ncbi:MAG: hypothetical protein RLZZ301_69 [Bacteroidota bacterium]|jgi:hypothetical protein
MKRLLKSKWITIPYKLALYGFATYGFILVGIFVAMKMRLTDDKGLVDSNNRYFQQMHDKYNQGFKVDSASLVQYRNEILEHINLVNAYYPKNARTILEAYAQSNCEKTALQMLAAVDLKLKDNKSYQRRLKQLLAKQQLGNHAKAGNVFEWMNFIEWSYFKEAVAKDKRYIDSAAAAIGVEPRMIVACLVGEQVRLFNSRRERFKDFVAPLKTLALETNMSFGVTGIKEETARNIERYLQDASSPYYCGEKYAHILAYDSTRNYSNAHNDTLSLRVKRLVQYKDHYYSYLYAGIFIRQIATQWKAAGCPIDERPEILASIFNLGYAKSKPKKKPAVGGSNFMIREKEYTFGGVAYDFYYSGELLKEFPYHSTKIAW